MYGLPLNFDGSFLLGRTLEAVCFSEYQIILYFDEELLITIESSFSLHNDEVVSVPVQNSNLMKLVGISVSEILSEKNGTLHLTFCSGDRLKLYDTSTQYESYRITYKGKDIIV